MRHRTDHYWTLYEAAVIVAVGVAAWAVLIFGALGVNWLVRWLLEWFEEL